MPNHPIKELLAFQTAADNELRIALAEQRRIAKLALKNSPTTDRAVEASVLRQSAVDSAVAMLHSLRQELTGFVVRRQPA